MAKAKAKAAPAPEEAAEVVVGSVVRFLGYDADTPEEEQVLEEGGEYEVVELPSEDGAGYVISFENPDFNSKKKENPESNPRFLETEVFDGEFELISSGEESEEVEEEEEAPAPKTKAKAKAEPKAEAKPAAKSKAKAKAEPEEEEAPKATPTKAGKGKAEAKAPAKTKAPAKSKAKAEPEEEEGAGDPDAVPVLETEDEEVLALVNEGTDLIELAQSLESEAAKNEYLLGGILYHIKLEGTWKDLDESYKEKGGYKQFLLDNFNIDYRKAQYLVDIYVNFQIAGIENPSEVVARLGWTKASKIAKYLPEEDEPEKLVETAETNSVSDLSTIIKDTYQEGGKGGDKGKTVKRVTCKFVYVEEEGNLIEDILADAASELGVTPAQALLQILTEYHATRAVGGQEEEDEEEEEEEVKPAKKAPAKPAAKSKGKARA